MWISFHSVELLHKYVICVVVMESSTYKSNWRIQCSYFQCIEDSHLSGGSYLFHS